MDAPTEWCSMIRQAVENLLAALESETEHTGDQKAFNEDCPICAPMKVCRDLLNAPIEPMDIIVAHAQRITEYEGDSYISLEPPDLIRKICEALLRCTNKEPS